MGEDAARRDHAAVASLREVLTTRALRAHGMAEHARLELPAGSGIDHLECRTVWIAADAGLLLVTAHVEVVHERRRVTSDFYPWHLVRDVELRTETVLLGDGSLAETVSVSVGYPAMSASESHLEHDVMRFGRAAVRLARGR